MLAAYGARMPHGDHCAVGERWRTKACGVANRTPIDEQITDFAGCGAQFVSYGIERRARRYVEEDVDVRISASSDDTYAEFHSSTLTDRRVGFGAEPLSCGRTTGPGYACGSVARAARPGSRSKPLAQGHPAPMPAGRKTYGLVDGAGCGEELLRGACVPEFRGVGVEFGSVVGGGEDSDVGAVSGVLCRESDAGG
jgi:hypothetical protein